MDFHKIEIPRNQAQPTIEMKKTFITKSGIWCEVGDIVCFVSPKQTDISWTNKDLSDRLYEVVYWEDTQFHERIAELRRIK